jgi:ribosome-associated protein
MTTDGVLLIDSREHRTQGQNREAARARLIALDPARHAAAENTAADPPNKAAKEHRIASKKRRGDVKSLRGRHRRSDD